MGAYINFDLVDTAELCGINIKRSTLTNDEVEARCPYCCDHRYRMYLNRLTNMFYCHNCGTGGNAVTLYSSFNPKGFRINAYDNNKKILELCAKYGVSIILGSDAHIEEGVGEFSQAEKILKETGFPEELVVNRSRSCVEKQLRL